MTFRDGGRQAGEVAVLFSAGPRRARVGEAILPAAEEWLIVEWPEGKDQPTDYWLSNLPADTKPERLARLARLRWKIELDYNSSRASSAWITTRAAPSSAGITTPRW